MGGKSLGDIWSSSRRMSRLRLPGDGVEALGSNVHASKVMIAVDSTWVHG